MNLKALSRLQRRHLKKLILISTPSRRRKMRLKQKQRDLTVRSRSFRVSTTSSRRSTEADLPVLPSTMQAERRLQAALLSAGLHTVQAYRLISDIESTLYIRPGSSTPVLISGQVTEPRSWLQLQAQLSMLNSLLRVRTRAVQDTATIALSITATVSLLFMDMQETFMSRTDSMLTAVRQ